MYRKFLSITNQSLAITYLNWDIAIHADLIPDHNSCTQVGKRGVAACYSAVHQKLFMDNTVKSLRFAVLEPKSVSASPDLQVLGFEHRVSICFSTSLLHHPTNYGHDPLCKSTY